MSYYQNKDMVKFAKCNKLISRGAIGSSSHRYSLLDDFWIPNAGSYSSSDQVGISVNGARRGRLSFDKNEVLLAISAGVSFITDNEYNRNRSFNIGEREIANFLIEHGYTAKDYPQGAHWTKA